MRTVAVRREATVGRRAWVLLETVLATGLLILGLAVIGTQVQDASYSVHRMDLETRALALAEMKLAELDLGIVELDSFDEVQEEEFGPRYPEFAWRLTTEKTGLEGLYLLTLEVLYEPRPPGANDNYTEGELDPDSMETVFTVYAIRATPQPVDLQKDFGLEDDEYDELSQKLADLGHAPEEVFDILRDPTTPLEDYLNLLIPVAEKLGIDINALTANLPPGMLDALRQSGILDDNGKDTSEDGGQSP